MAAAASAGVGSAGRGGGVRRLPAPGARRRGAGKGPRGAVCAAAERGVTVNALGVVPAMPCSPIPLARRAAPNVVGPARVCARRARAPRVARCRREGRRADTGRRRGARGMIQVVAAWKAGPSAPRNGAGRGRCGAARPGKRRPPEPFREQRHQHRRARNQVVPAGMCSGRVLGPPTGGEPPGQCNIRAVAPRHKRVPRGRTRRAAATTRRTPRGPDPADSPPRTRIVRAPRPPNGL